MNKPVNVPGWYWVVAVLAVIWNAMGVMAYVSQMMMTADAMAALPDLQRVVLESTPAWANGAFAIAVFGGFLGGILLLLRKKLATTLFMLSFIAILVQMYHAFVIANSYEVFGPGGLIMPIMVVVIGIALIWFAMFASRKAWVS
ncbi:MAG: hypothetical protein ACSHWU_02695 [Marinicella sp.]